jgi:hypothetical protein
MMLLGKRFTIDVLQALAMSVICKALPLNRGCHLVIKVGHLEMLIQQNGEQHIEDITRNIVAL